MDRLNYHHLLYFFTVAHEGSVARASKRLGLAQPTISAADPCPGKRAGPQAAGAPRPRPQSHPRRRNRPALRRQHLRPGWRICSPRSMAMPTPLLCSRSVSAPRCRRRWLPLFCKASWPRTPGPASPSSKPRLRRSPPSWLRARLHFALTDAPPANAAARGLHSRVLLESPIALFAPEPLARRVRKDFPACLPGVPVLMPSNGAAAPGGRTLARPAPAPAAQPSGRCRIRSPTPSPPEPPSSPLRCCTSRCAPPTACSPPVNWKARAGAPS